MEKITFSRQDLYNMVWSEPLTTLSKKYALSDNGLRKICKKNKIPLPQNGYWQKVKYGYKVKRLLFIEDPKLPNEISLPIRNNTDENPIENSINLKWFKEKISNCKGLSFKVPNKLNKPDELIVSAAKSFTTKDYRQDNGLISIRRKNINISVSHKNFSRALRIMDAIIKLLKARNHNVIIRSDGWYCITKVSIFEEEIEICLREKLKMIDKKTSWGTKEYVPSGILSFRQGSYYNFKETTDGIEPLENKLIDILAKLEMEAYKKSTERKRWQEQQRIKEEKERIARELRKQKEDELKNFIAIFNMANRFHQANYIRKYLREIEKHSLKEGQIPEKLKLWLVWAKEKVDWFDPFINKKDSLLDDFDKEKISKGFLSNHDF